MADDITSLNCLLPKGRFSFVVASAPSAEMKEPRECVCLCVRRLGARATDENIRVSILGTTSGRHHYAPRL
jgi:hypothetical protein